MQPFFSFFLHRSLIVLLVSAWFVSGLKVSAQSPRDSKPQANATPSESFDFTKVGAKSPWPELRHLRTRGDFATDEQEAREIEAIYAVAQAAFAAVAPGPDAGALNQKVLPHLPLAWLHH